MRPTARVRSLVMDRDGSCIAGCGTVAPLEFQHRSAVGMGGSKFSPSPVDGVAACGPHNTRFESDLQLAALVYGWKVPRWVTEQGLAGRVPVLYWAVKQWCLLESDGRVWWVTPKAALLSMGAVYGEEEYAGWLDVLRAEQGDFGGNQICHLLPVK